MSADEGSELALKLLFSKADVRIISAWVFAGMNVWRADAFAGDVSLGSDQREIPYLRSNYLFTRALEDASTLSNSVRMPVPEVLFNDDAFLVTSLFFVYQMDVFSASTLKSAEYVERPLTMVRVELSDCRKLEHRSLTGRNLPDLVVALRAMASADAKPGMECDSYFGETSSSAEANVTLPSHSVDQSPAEGEECARLHSVENDRGGAPKVGKATLKDAKQALLKQMNSIQKGMSSISEQIRTAASATSQPIGATTAKIAEPGDEVLYQGAAGLVTRSFVQTQAYYVPTETLRAVEFATHAWHRLPNCQIAIVVTTAVVICVFLLPMAIRFTLLTIAALVAYRVFRLQSDNFKSKRVVTLTLNDGTKRYLIEREGTESEMEPFASAVMKVIKR